MSESLKPPHSAAPIADANGEMARIWREHLRVIATETERQRDAFDGAAEVDAGASLSDLITAFNAFIAAGKSQ